MRSKRCGARRDRNAWPLGSHTHTHSCAHLQNATPGQRSRAAQRMFASRRTLAPGNAWTQRRAMQRQHARQAHTGAWLAAGRSTAGSELPAGARVARRWRSDGGNCLNGHPRRCFGAPPRTATSAMAGSRARAALPHLHSGAVVAGSRRGASPTASAGSRGMTASDMGSLAPAMRQPGSTPSLAESSLAKAKAGGSRSASLLPASGSSAAEARKAARDAAAEQSLARAAAINQQGYTRMLFDRSKTTFEVHTAIR